MRSVAAGPVNWQTATSVVPVAALTDLHQSPPITLRAISERRRWLFPAAVGVAVVLGVLAAIGNGRWLVWDPPITRVSIGLRTPGVNRVALWVSRLGSTPVVVAGGLVGVVLAARRCRSVAVVMLVTVVARPPFEWLVKEVVARPRPSGAQLVPGTGFAYPSGHVLAAAATWGFVPVIAGILRPATLGLVGADDDHLGGDRAGCLVPGVAGVHWTSDVVGALAIAFVALSTAEAALDRRHRPDTPGDRPDVPGAKWSHDELLTGPGADRDDPDTTLVRSGATTPNAKEPSC